MKYLNENQDFDLFHAEIVRKIPFLDFVVIIALKLNHKPCFFILIFDQSSVSEMFRFKMRSPV